jgi:hypothetical protein
VREWVYFIQVSRTRYKIGISGNLEARMENFREKLAPFDMVIYKTIKVRNAGKWEKYLHNYFSDKQRYFARLRGDGGTEVFALNWIEVLLVMWLMWRIQNRTWIFAGVALLVILAVSWFAFYIDLVTWNDVKEYLLSVRPVA